ncbi:MAG: hypothetical protein A2832_02215 [Candidatus Zambryskibacteria bacterium RIFCSPHIGHO2_01_FULL_44_22b]|uniref:Uncharacterized protein n=2 Tax=Candidatus Zambryskiibacteriota TaxID=1817925 RepID=A0A1G2SZ96_9BACT|nr:MAG: hypothetical protein A2832_02215 [Candidatus Zambryskibacteria bacterium RIFCSPHIGHO2_01_FULL_44_22b]OHB05510.1 MAG: hypothetical protein A3B16_00235 [Candidatus Zambryskibacteria bacterium RIFCSPLOWO2_01_FULL_45_43]
MEENPEEKFNPPTGEPAPLRQIRTFQGDIAEALQRQNESLVSIQQAEVARRGFSESVPESGGNKKFYFLLGTVILLAFGATGVWYTYFEYKTQTTAPIVVTPQNRFFSIDTEERLNVASTSRLELIGTISAAQTGVGSNETKQLVLDITTVEFFKILNTRAPGSLVRAFDQSLMLGAFGENTFLVIKLVSFENAFAGMLSWEKDLAADIGPIFNTRELLRDIGPETVFIDVTDRNKDVRALEIEGKMVLLYSFFDNNMLIITDDIETLRVLVERLTREKLSR